MPRADFLLEIGCEEIPVAYIEPALAQLEAGLAAYLAAERLEHGPIQRFATARRLALLVPGLALAQADRDEELTGPPVAAAFKDGQPTPAALGFARSQGVSLEALHTLETPRGSYLALKRRVPGRPAAELLAAGLPGLILGLRFPKTMTWGDGSLRFARPIRWLVALLDAEVLPLALGRCARGGRAPGAGSRQRRRSRFRAPATTPTACAPLGSSPSRPGAGRSCSPRPAPPLRPLAAASWRTRSSRTPSTTSANGPWPWPAASPRRCSACRGRW